MCFESKRRGILGLGMPNGAQSQSRIVKVYLSGSKGIEIMQIGLTRTSNKPFINERLKMTAINFTTTTTFIIYRSKGWCNIFVGNVVSHKKTFVLFQGGFTFS